MFQGEKLKHLSADLARKQFGGAVRTAEVIITRRFRKIFHFASLESALVAKSFVLDFDVLLKLVLNLEKCAASFTNKFEGFGVNFSHVRSENGPENCFEVLRREKKS